MKLRELYPYWSDSHSELTEALEILDDAQWEWKPIYDNGRTIRQIAIHLIETERFWIQHVAQQRPYERVLGSEFDSYPDIIDQLRSTRAATEHYVETLTPAGLRSVRTAPGDPATNEMERNVAISWIIWHVLEHELYHWGQIALLDSLWEL